jgi:uncharacterized protein (DUF362 family)
MEEGFVNVKTLFATNLDRNLDYLQKIYLDRELIYNSIVELCGKELKAEKIAEKKVLLKPNWVRHTKVKSDEFCLCTNEAVILSLLTFVLEKKPSIVVIGDAPVQGCNWDKLISPSFYEEVKLLSKKHNTPIEVKDFRRVSFNPLNNKLDEEKNPLSNYTIFDVGKESYLEPISNPLKNLFRVTQYNPDRFIHTHTLGMHKYCIINELFSSDVVISIPKVKTHQKAGITAALKNIVGLNGDKDFLPHHRIGGTSMGGDSYPGGNLLRYLSEIFLDNANRKKGRKIYWFWLRLASLFWKLSLPGKKFHLSAAWFGNDTTWRMVMDLNKIVVFGKKDGTLAKTPQRFMYSLCDGIVGGQGDGPLKPDPLNLGVLSFSNDSAYSDLCLATLMGLNIEKIPLLIAAKNFIPGRKRRLFLNGNETTFNDLKNIATVTTPPPGWINYQDSKK